MQLFEPLIIRKMTLKNRIIMPPMQVMLGLLNRRVRAYFLERARGGVGAVTIQATAVDLLIDDQAWNRAGALKNFIQGMRAFTDEIREAGAKIGIQLWHGNQLPAGSGAPIIPGAKSIAPSAVDNLEALTREEINLIIQKFTRASQTAREAGFDFINFHGAHGYLLCQFFSGATNKRNDEYGGDLQRRMRFGLEVVRSVRKAVGEDFPLFYRLGAEEKVEGGITLEESRAFSKELEKAGIDVLDISFGRTDGLEPSPGKKSEMGAMVYLAEAIKPAVHVPVMAVGRLHNLNLAESILKTQKADLIGIGRQLIADPFWPQKIREGREQEIVACESCNTCFTPMRSTKWKPGDRICKVNERAGREMDLPKN
jgi:2,4-dienoyl-CoA reductase-like NADH-dependent reductase (Old Yellow Enzyme family)